MRPEDLAFAPDSFAAPTTRAPIRVTWLGTAGFAIEHEGVVVLIDPYVTRASMWQCVRAPLVSDLDAIARYVPRADAIVTGHTHFDHALDVPAIARATGAKVYGSRSCVHLCRASGVPQEQVIDVEGRDARAEVGPFELRFVPSAHSAFALGRVPFPGDIADCDEVPLATHRYKCGAVFGVDVRVAGKRIYHLGSANLVDAAPERDVDLLLMCVAGWTTTERFAPRVMRALAPRAVLLSHWDDFFSPMRKGARALPAMKMPRLVDQLVAQDRDVRIGTVPLLGSIAI
ncbi:MBL fold metallo-hydrolase [Sandaracinus amylolyticus]|nr:MBL fold metallo-hydrolase [Sandaracinus amylolyticus]